MIRIKIVPAEGYTKELGEATVTLDVDSKEGRGRPVIRSEDENLEGSLSLKLLTLPTGPYGHTIDPSQHTGGTVMLGLSEWNFAKAYDIVVEEGEEYTKIEWPKLPPGVIP